MAVGNSVLDLAFAMDCTSSMGTYIKNATDNIRLIVDEIVTKEKVTVRLALIEYRDHPPQDNTFVTRVHSFTNTVTEMKGWLDQCSAEGGGDGPEAVADALNDALNLSWQSVGAKVCILISDAPPHGLVPAGDSFPGGCPAGHDPLTIVRKMAEKHITLYTVGVEPPIVPYRDFFMTLAHITGGQYVPMVDANRLAQMIIAGVREEISLDRLMHTARDEITREVRKSAASGTDDRETASRLQKIFTTKKMYVNRMKNEGGTPSIEAEESYSKCVDMADMQKQYKTTQSASNMKTSNMDYNLEVDSTVSFEQAKRIVQKAKNWNYSAGEQTNSTACRYKEKCYDHSENHRSKYSHPETGNLSSRRNHETERGSSTIRNQERNLDSQRNNQLTSCQYQEKCYDHSANHRAKYSHPQTERLSSRRNQETERSSPSIRNQERNLHSQRDNQQTPCQYQEKCYDHSESHRSKYSHPRNNTSSTQRNQETERSDHRTSCKHGISCYDHSDYHRAKYSHNTTRP